MCGRMWDLGFYMKGFKQRFKDEGHKDEGQTDYCV